MTGFITKSKGIIVITPQNYKQKSARVNTVAIKELGSACFLTLGWQTKNAKEYMRSSSYLKNSKSKL